MGSLPSHCKNYLLLFSIQSEMPDLELADDLKKTVCLRAGGTLRLFVSVTGRPTPVVTWRKTGVELQSRGYIETTDSYTSLLVEKVNRYDSGKYVVEAENPSGKKTSVILVKVYGKFCQTWVSSLTLPLKRQLRTHESTFFL